jgi:hypothetical protein
MFQKIFETLETFIAMCCQYEKDIWKVIPTSVVREVRNFGING